MQSSVCPERYRLSNIIGQIQFLFALVDMRKKQENRNM